MRVHVERRWDRQVVDIYMFSVYGMEKSRQMIYDGDGLWHDEELDGGATATKPSFTLPTMALEQIVAQAHDVLPPSAATDAALKDAREVRDRALGMVERIIDSDLAREASSRPSTTEQRDA